MRLSLLAIAATLSATIVSCSAGNPALKDQGDGMYAVVKTPKGDIVLKLEYEKAPLTVCNFVGLAEGTLDASKGKRYFDGLSFHRVVPDFVIQTGDPQATGRGGPGYQFPNEIDPSLKYDKPGMVGMANAGPDTNGSQFFITLSAVDQLTGGYTIFGSVVAGMDVVKKIAQGDKMDSVEIVRKGDAAKAFKADQATWNELNAKLAAARNADKQKATKAQLDAILAKYPGLEPMPQGLLSKILVEGKGAPIGANVTVKALYKGMLADGTVFDASELHGNQPLEVKVGAGQVIPGWDIVLQLMKVGEKRVVAIPPDLAYGAGGVPGVIPPESFLVFEMQVLEAKP